MRLRFRFLLLLLLIPGAFATAQDLLNSRHSSYFTYIYRLAPAEAHSLYETGLKVTNETFFHTLVDSFPTDSLQYKGSLPVGHYFFAHVQDAQLKLVLHSEDRLDIQLLNNKQDLGLIVHDSLGQPITDARVFVENKRIAFDAATQRYQLQKTHRKGLLRIEHGGHSSYFRIDHTGKGGRKFQLKRLHLYLIYYTPIRFVWLPIKALIRTIRWRNPTGWIRRVAAIFVPEFRRNEGEKKGYIVFSQPLYRPGDTVRFKAFITRPKGKPIDRTMEVFLRNPGYQTQALATITPERKGVYIYEFVLHDSLQLRLDQNYALGLRTTVAWNTFMLGSFRLEDYELDETSYVFRSDPEQHSPGIPMAFYARGADANDLNLLDADVDLYAFPKSIDRIAADSLFLPDTLWTFQQRLDPVGETKILLPESILPDANLSYEVQAVFTNAANERHEEKKILQYLNEARKLKLSLEADTLKARHLLRGKSSPQAGLLYALSLAGDTLSRESVTLPYQTPVNPYVHRYLLVVGSLQENMRLDRNQPSQLSCFAYRTADSLFVQVENPRNLPFWHFLYRKNNLIEKGQGSSWQVAMPATRNQNYFVSLQYIWGGKVEEAEYKVSFADKALKVAFEQPDKIYPGQTTDIAVRVTDAQGNPVSDTDLTAWGLTTQFKTAGAPEVPDFSKTYPNRKQLHTFSEKQVLPGTPQHSLTLDYPRWNALTSLDSIAWFQFLYPDSGFYQYALPVKDTMAQIVPFAVQNGLPLDVHMINIDEKWVYFSGVTALQRYTFAVRPGYHSIRLRTAEYVIDLDSVQVLSGQKLIFSVDAQPFNPRATVRYVGKELKPATLAALSRMLMPVRRAANGTQLAISQDGRYQLSQHQGTYGYQSLVFGPLYPKEFHYQAQLDSVGFTETFEPGYDYEFDPRRIKMRTVNMQDRIAKQLTETHRAPVFTDSLLTEAEIRALWDYSLVRSERAYYYSHVYNEPQATTRGHGRLQVETGRRDSVVHQLLFDVNNPDFIRIYPGHERLFHQLKAGEYLLVGLRSDSSFFRIRGLKVRVNGLNYFKKNRPAIEPSSVFSIQLLQLVNDRIGTQKLLEAQKEAIKSQYRPGLVAQPKPTTFTHWISGRVIHEESGTPIPGATILIEGTTTGTVSDLDGYFALYGPPDAVLRVSYVGFELEEIPVSGTQSLEIGLTASASMLEEVVVVAYGSILEKQTLTTSVTTLSSQLAGRMPGVQTTFADGIRIRGQNSLNWTNPLSPLYLIDGVIVSGDDPRLSSEQIASMEVLQGEAATALYGSRAAGGAILITTKDFQEARQKEIDALSEDALQVGDAGNSLRSNFRDNAFWQPNLLTGKDGQATFSVTFPDDITKWKTFALAMGPRKQSGQCQGEVKAYKELMAQLSLPRFLVQGDTTFVIGKVLNYSPDTLSVSTSFRLNEEAPQLRQGQVVTALFDTLMLTAPATDSLSITYSMERENGYFDGEKRSIPLFLQGTKETSGQFFSLDRDTTFSLRLDPNFTSVSLYAQASPLRVLLEEMERLRNYRHLCNEQAASKLKSLLMEKKVRDLLGEPINVEKDVEKLLKKLRETQDSEGLWGWWANGAYNPWISRHVLEALLAAEAAGYSVQFNRQAAIDQLVYQLERSTATPAYRMESLFLLKKLGGRVDFVPYVDSLRTDTTLSQIEQFQLIELQQTLELPYTLDTLFAQQQETLFGNLYWGNVAFHPYYNNYTPTLAAYRILRNHGGEATRLRKIRNYLFEQKRDGYWVNTYAASAILEAILPEVLDSTKEISPPRLVLSGAVDTAITRFPYRTTFSSRQQLTLQKTGTTPVYFSAFQTQWNPQPAAVGGDFTVSSLFISRAQGDTLRHLDAGEPVTLRVQVEVTKLSEFMMVEIPIPAGCSYAGKPAARWRYPEVHRAYDRAHVNIFCERLSPGTYTFDVELLPRYTGAYALNPARIEQMYFPVFFGRNAGQRVRVE